jgi:hypothetical protein
MTGPNRSEGDSINNDVTILTVGGNQDLEAIKQTVAFSLLGGVLGMPSSPEPSGSTAPAKCSWLPAQ